MKGWRIISNSLSVSGGQFCISYLVPGGHYLVVQSEHCLGVWDLRCVSNNNMSSNGKLLAAVFNSIKQFFVYPTPDRLAIRIVVDSFHPDEALRVYEMYPQRETPELIQIGELFLGIHGKDEISCFSNGNKVIVFGHKNGHVIVWDFIADTVACWSVGGGIDEPYKKVVEVAETTIILPLGFSL